MVKLPVWGQLKEEIQACGSFAMIAPKGGRDAPAAKDPKCITFSPTAVR
jgi:hypothetical protein